MHRVGLSQASGIPLANEPVVPPENVAIYSLLFQIETGLREVIIDCLAATDGPRWYIHRLPGDVLEKYRSARAVERAVPWARCVPHHPIYYTDFPDLHKTLCRDDNWRDAFAALFGRKEFVGGMFAQLEVIRNKVAHNRKSTPIDLQLVEAALSANNK